MPTIRSLTDDMAFEAGQDETVLAAGLRSGIAFAHACGGRAKCSTCRISVIDGLDVCAGRTVAEAAMAERLGLTDEIRLACQLRATGDVSVRRLVLDETDLLMSSQLDRDVASRIGESREITVFFSDITGFTAISETLPPYDVMYMLNRYFVQVGDIIERYGGFIDKFVGDGVMALFGVEDTPDAPLRAVAAALQILAAVDRMKPFFARIYGVDFDIRIGLHHGEAVIGSVGSIGHERLTAIGDVVNLASRIEAANKEAGTRLLISEALHEQVKDNVRVADFLRIRPKGANERITLYEIEGLTEAAQTLLDAASARETMLYAGKKWTRVFAVDELADGAWRILNFDEFDVVVLRRGDSFHAFNNACPHLHIPLFETRAGMRDGDIGYFPGTERPRPLYSTFTEDDGLICRWHESLFDLQTGEVREWVPRLQEDGTSQGWEFIGDLSKNKCRLSVYPGRVHEGHLWIALE